MASYQQQAVIAVHVDFTSRVRMAMIRHAQFQVVQGNDAAGLVTLGKAVLSSPIGHGESFTRVVATEPSIQAGIDASPTDGSAVTDAEILAAVEAIFPSFAR